MEPIDRSKKKFHGKNHLHCGAILFFLSFAFLGLNAQGNSEGPGDPDLLKNDTLTLANKRISFKYLWNDGNLMLSEIFDKNTKKSIKTDKLVPDVYLMGEKTIATSPSFKAHRNVEDGYTDAEITFDLGPVRVKRILRLYDGAKALKNIYFFKGEARADAWTSVQNKNMDLIEEKKLEGVEHTRMGIVDFNALHWKFRAVSFTDATDHHDNLVKVDKFLSYRNVSGIRANLLYASLPEDEKSLFILKEAPIGYSQQAYPGFDFLVSDKSISIHGIGVSPSDLNKHGWIRGYGYAIGLTSDTISEERFDLLDYQKKQEPDKLVDDFMIMANTWGDRSQDSRMKEPFILDEISKAGELGINYLQLDDGWQQGLSKNSASKEGKAWNDWQKKDWMPNDRRFPNGFGRIIDRAGKKNVEIGLWFNPSKANSYGKWEQDADILLGLYKEYGIKTFKIDGVDLMDKKSETNLRSFLSKVMDGTGNRAMFNLDVTAGRRTGFHYFNEFGTIFLENRYTDWGNYYPYRTLRNLWMLSAYVPTERLQMEFLNVYRNPDNYKNDRFAPSQVGLDFAFAVSMVAQPLAWMELSGLQNTPKDFPGLIASYRKIAPRLHSGVTLPMGQRPDGRSWTGFLSLGNDNEHFLLVYREAGDQDHYRFKLPLNVTDVEQLLGDRAQTELTNGNQLNIGLEDKWSFSLFRLRGSRPEF